MATALAGIGAPLGVWMVRVCPPHTRFSSVAVGYNAAMAMFGGTAPLVGAALIRWFGSTGAPGAWGQAVSHRSQTLTACFVLHMSGAYVALTSLAALLSVMYAQRSLGVRDRPLHQPSTRFHQLGPEQHSTDPEPHASRDTVAARVSVELPSVDVNQSDGGGESS